MCRLEPTTTCHCYLKQKYMFNSKKVLEVSQTLDHRKQQLKMEHTYPL